MAFCDHLWTPIRGTLFVLGILALISGIVTLCYFSSLGIPEPVDLEPPTEVEPELLEYDDYVRKFQYQGYDDHHLKQITAYDVFKSHGLPGWWEETGEMIIGEDGIEIPERVYNNDHAIRVYKETPQGRNVSRELLIDSAITFPGEEEQVYFYNTKGVTDIHRMHLLQDGFNIEQRVILGGDNPELQELREWDGRDRLSTREGHEYENELEAEGYSPAEIEKSIQEGKESAKRKVAEELLDNLHKADYAGNPGHGYELREHKGYLKWRYAWNGIEEGDARAALNAHNENYIKEFEREHGINLEEMMKADNAQHIKDVEAWNMEAQKNYENHLDKLPEERAKAANAVKCRVNGQIAGGVTTAAGIIAIGTALHSAQKATRSAEGHKTSSERMDPNRTARRLAHLQRQSRGGLDA